MRTPLRISKSQNYLPLIPNSQHFPICVEDPKHSESPELYPFYTFPPGMNFFTSPLKIFYKDSTFDHREIENPPANFVGRKHSHNLQACSTQTS